MKLKSLAFLWLQLHYDYNEVNQSGSSHCRPEGNLSNATRMTTSYLYPTACQLKWNYYTTKSQSQSTMGYSICYVLTVYSLPRSSRYYSIQNLIYSIACIAFPCDLSSCLSLYCKSLCYNLSDSDIYLTNEISIPWGPIFTRRIIALGLGSYRESFRSR